LCYESRRVAGGRRAPDAPTAPQIEGWPSIRARRHTLIAAPTGSGKTLAAFPAASNDIHRNLESPLAGIQRQLLEMGSGALRLTYSARSAATGSRLAATFAG